jgi:hypothetical protein
MMIMHFFYCYEYAFFYLYDNNKFFIAYEFAYFVIFIKIVCFLIFHDLANKQSNKKNSINKSKKLNIL